VKSQTPVDVGAVLFGKGRRQVLALLFGQPEQAFYFSEIVAFVGTGMGQVQRELQALTRAGLLLREKRGNHVYFRANPNAPIFEDIRNIVRKTFGVADVLREALGRFEKHIDTAFIYGSIARGEETAASDVDVLIVGDVRLSQMASGITAAEAAIKRTVSPTIYTPKEFAAKIHAKQHFLARVLAGPKLFLIGDQTTLDDLARGKAEQP
jgi:predicted nucleotidyltransferase